MATRTRTASLDVARYLELTRSVTVSFAYLLPLLAAYEVGVARTGTDLRNSAELFLKQSAGFFGAYAVWIQRLLLVFVAVLAARLAFRNVPALRLYPVFLLESLLLALLLGPVVSTLVSSVGLEPAVAAAPTERVLLSLGAGVYEEIVFRFLLLAGGFALLHRGLGLRRGLSFGIALGVSALLFALYHHLGPWGEPLRARALLFRSAAGLVLGLVFAARGLALCAYLHAFYDVLCDLHDDGAGA